MKIPALRKIFITIVAAAIFLSEYCLCTFAQTAYTDDSFRHISTQRQFPVSGWDFDKTGGNIAYTSNSGILLRDTSNTASVKMKKQLNTNSAYDKNYIFEAVITPSRNAQGYSVSLYNNENSVLKLETMPDVLSLSADGQVKKLCAYTAAEPIGIRIEIDRGKKIAAARINGTLCGEIDISETFINAVELSTAKNSKGTLLVDSVKLYGNYAVNEAFITSTGKLPDDWRIISGTAQPKPLLTSAGSDRYSLEIESGGQVLRSFDIGEENCISCDFRFLPRGKAIFVFGDSAGSSFEITSENDALFLGTERKCVINSKVWQHLLVKINRSEKSVRVILNGKEISKDTLEAAADLSSVTVKSLEDKLYIDDIKIFSENENVQPLNISKVRGDTAVGMIRCDLWREGAHLGWDYISPYEENIPYIGFYDDGNTRAADYEIKYMAEHGVTFQMNCWFTPRGWSGNEIKIPASSYALEDGYFNSKYSNMLDFAIMWENQGSVSEDNFKNYIIPYWIEYYFKDSRYLKIDNKPVISIYNASSFLSETCGGNIAKAKEVLNYLREECKKIGYSGAIILCASNGLSSVSSEKEIGFDACHAYTWGDSTKKASTQIKYLQKAANNSAKLCVVPTVSVGIDETPWNRPSGAMLPPDEFKTVLAFADAFEAFQNIGGIGKMVLLDNWNEYGEGHYIMPAAKYGFLYLDAVRSVFCKNAQEHIDEIPSDDEKNNMGVLYPKNRVLPSAEKIQIPVGTTVVKEWKGLDFNTWSTSANTSKTVDEKGIFVESSGNDPCIYLNSNLDINTTDINYIEIKASRNGSDRWINVFYTTEENEPFSQQKSLSVLADNSGDINTYYIPVWQCEDFGEILRRLRLDIINSSGSFLVESVRLLKGNPGDVKKLFVNGVKQSLKTPIAFKNGSYYIQLRDIETIFQLSASYMRSSNSLIISDGKNRFEFTNEGKLYKNDLFLNSYESYITYDSGFMLPMQALSDICETDISYDSENGKIYIDDKKLFPQKTYNISEDTDENGLWRYRNIAPNPSCDDLNFVWQPKYENDKNSVFLSDEYAQSKGGSVKKVFKSAYTRLGYEVDLKPNTDYYVSAWLKGDNEDNIKNMAFAEEFTAFDENGKRIGLNQLVLSTDDPMFSLSTNWEYISKKVRTDIFTKNGNRLVMGDKYSSDNSKLYLTTSSSEQKTVLMDDISIREIPPFDVYTKAISHADGEKIGDEEIVFTFSCDIDIFSVTPDKITINGKSGDGKLTATVLTDSESRETKLIINISPPSPEERVLISLKDIKDAWGRDIKGGKEVTVVGGKPYIAAEFEYNEILKASFNVCGETGDADAIVSLKNGNKQTDVSYYSITDTNRTFSYDIQNKEWDRIEVFLLKDIKSLAPITKKYVFEKTAIEGSLMKE